jgi:hypothetical protein
MENGALFWLWSEVLPLSKKNNTSQYTGDVILVNKR